MSDEWAMHGERTRSVHTAAAVNAVNANANAATMLVAVAAMVATAAI